MAEIIKVRGRHRTMKIMGSCGPTKVPTLICTNCRKFTYLDERDNPEDSSVFNSECASDLDLRKLGDSRLADYREQEMRIRGTNEQRERDELQQLGQLDRHGNPIMHTERGHLRLVK